MKRKKLAVIESEPVGQGILEVLDEIRERVARGEVSQISVALVSRTGCISTTWSKIYSVAATLGAVGRLQYDINAGWDDVE